MSSSSSDENDEIEERLDDIIEDFIDEIYDAIVEAEPIPQRTRSYTERHREGGQHQLSNDYFNDDHSIYSIQTFRRRFRMNKGLFIRIVDGLEQFFPFFQQRKDATGRWGSYCTTKMYGSNSSIAYGNSADTVDEYLRLGESTALSCLHHFTDGIIQLFGDEYLRLPTTEDLQRLLDMGEKRGFPGMVGSIDCMHWEWKNCPTAWKGQYARGHGKPTIVLEPVASQDLWIWHAFFGLPGTLNDLNVLDRSPLFDDLLEGRAPRVRYMVNNHMYKLAYYLTYGIYPKWSTFIQTITFPQSPKQQLFAQVQESVRKDVKRDFGVLQARFAIVKNPGFRGSDPFMIHAIPALCVAASQAASTEHESGVRDLTSRRGSVICLILKDQFVASIPGRPAHPWENVDLDSGWRETCTFPEQNQSAFNIQIISYVN
ncbi:uncharacterized protein LOC111213889 [Brassica napus]|uniref:uncharacterized protein LOC111213889 n=1 Tax=Brassica napus TaxID=3708 RepID=UPI00207AF678|nr:uncharacterized protein LOC111213889 [Brassica napus]